jgi:D-arginine dehydrogenase
MTDLPSHLPRRVAIVGGGIAGAAAAAALRRRLGVSVRIFEQESEDGCHASGLNAGMIRQAVRSEPLSALARETAAAFAAERRRDPSFPFVPGGSLLIAGPDHAAALEEAARRAEAEFLSPDSIAGAAPGEMVLHTPGDGLVAPRALLGRFLRDALDAGAVHDRRRVEALETRGGRVSGVRVAEESQTFDLVILAAGAWCSELAASVQAQSIPLLRRRRHLVPCRVDPLPAEDGPFIWHLDDRVYMRPWRLEDGRPGLLACAGDDEIITDCRAEADFEPLRARLEATLARFLPAGDGGELGIPWAGVRTFSADGDFVVGFDAQCPGLFWLAGLGGHGVSSSWALGRLVADLVAGETCAVGEALSPHRFLKEGMKR